MFPSLMLYEINIILMIPFRRVRKKEIIDFYIECIIETCIRLIGDKKNPGKK